MLDFIKTKHTPFVGAYKMVNSNGKEIGPFGAYKKLYACYGCISKEDLLLVGDILFKPSFKYSWGDIDLSLRVWEKGGKVEVCNQATIIPQQVNDDIYKEHRKNYFNKDEEMFLGYWHKKFGEGYERKGSSVNRRLN
jgi:GT2 family glycosyltransferase